MKNTPRDFFLHFGAFGTLYLAAIALGTLLFRMIDYTFPDPVRDAYYYYDPYSGAMRFAIASLIILLPIFLWLMRVIQREARQEPERYSLAIRRWLTYMTLFVAGATIIGDLIALLNSFLGGTLATPFLLKVLVLFAIVGVVFWYFLLDIRGYWQGKENTSKAVGMGVLPLTIAIIISGFLIMGSPMAQREIRLDQQEVQDLTTIQNEIVNYWQLNQRLPDTLSEIESDITYFHVPNPPEGREAYEYNVRDALTFELCATFETASNEYGYGPDTSSYTPPIHYGLMGDLSWEHRAGRMCFEREIDPDLIMPLPGPYSKPTPVPLPSTQID